MTVWAGGFRESLDLQCSQWKWGGAGSKAPAGDARLHGAHGKYAYKIVGIPTAVPLLTADQLMFCGSLRLQQAGPRAWP